MHPFIASIWPRTFFFALVTVSFFILISRLGDISLAVAFTIINDRAFIVALLVTVPFPFLSALRWKYTVNGLGIPLSLKHAWEIVMGTWLFSILPGRIGDFLRPYALPRGTPTALGLGSILFEKFVDILALLAISAVGFMLTESGRDAGIVILFLVALSLICFFGIHRIIPFAPQGIREKMKDFADAAICLARNGSALGRIAAASTLNWLLSMAQIFFLFQALGSNVPIAAIFAYVPLAIFIGLIPVTLAGMGTRDSALVLFFTGLAAKQHTLGVGIWYSLLGFWLFALLGIPYLVQIARKFRHDSGAPLLS